MECGFQVLNRCNEPIINAWAYAQGGWIEQEDIISGYGEFVADPVYKFQCEPCPQPLSLRFQTQNRGVVEFTNAIPSFDPTDTNIPTNQNWCIPLTSSPTAVPTAQPSVTPSSDPSTMPTVQPTDTPSSDPTAYPSVVPTRYRTESLVIYVCVHTLFEKIAIQRQQCRLQVNCVNDDLLIP